MGEKHQNIQRKDINSTSSSSSFTDALLTGSGAVREGMKTGGTWIQQERMHINELELLALKLALEIFLTAQEIKSWHVQIDNILALTYFVKIEGTKIYTWFVCTSKFGN